MPEYKQTVIVKNNGSSDIMIEDLGITVSSGAVITLTDYFDIYVILGSNDLYDFVTNEDLVINNGSDDLDVDIARDFLTIETIKSSGGSSGTTGKLFHYQVYEDKDINNGKWLESWPDGHDSGNWSGYSDGNKIPYIFPFNCKLSYIDLFFKGADYDWRSSAGNLYLTLALMDHNYNSAYEIVRYNFTLEGNFTGNKIDHDSFKFTEPSFTIMSGSQDIIKPAIIGIMFRKDNSQPGQIYKLKDPIINLTFEGI